MDTLQAEALVLRSLEFGESDRIVHLLTPRTGRLTVMAKGARRSRKRFPGTLDLFNLLRIQAERRRSRSMARLESARLLRCWPALREQPLRFALGCYLLEILGRLAPEGGPPAEMAQLFDFATGALDWLAQAPPDERVRTLLELRTLDALGLRPELVRCVRCGRPLAHSGWARDRPLAFHVAEGGPLCASCTPLDHGLLQVHIGTLRALERSLHFAPEQLGRIAWGRHAMQEAAALLRLFLRFHLGLELRSQSFLDEQLTLPGPGGRIRPPAASGRSPSSSSDPIRRRP